MRELDAECIGKPNPPVTSIILNTTPPELRFKKPDLVSGFFILVVLWW